MESKQGSGIKLEVYRVSGKVANFRNGSKWMEKSGEWARVRMESRAVQNREDMVETRSTE